MINLKLTLDQADELAWLLTSMNIEPVPTGTLLIDIFDKPVDHPLWPILKQLRSLIQIQPPTTVFCIKRSTRGGQPKKYCSGACKQRATRARQRID